MHALAHLAERRTLYVVPEPLLAVRVGTEWTAADRERATRELEYVALRSRPEVLGLAERRAGRAGDRAAGVPGGAAAGRDAALPAGSPAREPHGDRADRRPGGLGARARQERSAARRPSAPRLCDRDCAPERHLRADRRLHRQRGDREGRPLVRRRRAVPATARPRDVDLAGHRVDRLDAAAARRALRPLRDRPGDEPVSRAGDDPEGARAAPRDAGRRLDPGRRARQAAPREDVGARRGGSTDATAARPVAPRRRLACGAVPGPARDLRAEQRPRDRLDARGRGDRHA